MRELAEALYHERTGAGPPMHEPARMRSWYKIPELALSPHFQFPLCFSVTPRTLRRMSTEITPKMLRRMASMLVSHDRRVKDESEKSPRYESHVDWMTRTVPDIARSGDSRVHISSVIARSLVSKEGHRVDLSVKALSTALQTLSVLALPVNDPILMVCSDGIERSITDILLSKPDGRRLHDVLVAFDEVLEALEKICVEVPTKKMRLTTLRIQSWLVTPSNKGSFVSRKVPTTKQPTEGQQCQVALVPGVDSMLQSIQSISSNRSVSTDVWNEFMDCLVEFVSLIVEGDAVYRNLNAIADAPRVYQDDDETERTVNQKIEEGLVPASDIPDDAIAPVALPTVRGLKHALAEIDESGKVSKFCCVGRTSLPSKDRALIALALSIPAEAVEYIKVDSGSDSDPEPHAKRVCRANDEAVAAC